jgi:hypothetical protein
MPVIAMGVMAGASTLFSSLMGGQQQAAQNAAQRAQFEEQEFQRKMNNQIKNRQIAKANAAKWMLNKNIAKAANQARAEEEFWLSYNFDNSSGNFSRGFQQANNQIKTTLTSRGVRLNSGTSRVILNQSLEAGRRQMTNQRISKSNAMIGIERRQQQTLAQRDFGYNDQVKFSRGQLIQQSDSSIMQNALISGLVTGGLAGASAAMSTQHSVDQTAAANRSASYTGMLALQRMLPY